MFATLRNVKCAYPQSAQEKATKRARPASNGNQDDSRKPTRPAHSAAKASKTVSKGDSVSQRHDQGVGKEISPPPSLSWTAESLGDPSNDVFMFDDLHNPDSAMDGIFDDLVGQVNPATNDFSSLDGPFTFPADFSGTLGPMKSMQETFDFYDNPLLPRDDSHNASSDTDNTSNGLLSIPSSPPSNAASRDAGRPDPERAEELQQQQDASHRASPVTAVASISRPCDPARSEIAQRPNLGPATNGAFKPDVGSTCSSPQVSCQCLTSALSLLETLAIEIARASGPTIARILHFKKRALAQCNMLLDCQRCSSVSSFLILLVVFCEKMVTSYELVLAILTKQYKSRQGREPVGTSTTRSHSGAFDAELEEERQMAVKDYDLDMEEQPCVFGNLASMQMRKMRTFLARVKAVLRQWKCDPHIATVDSVEERLRQQLRLFNKDSNEL
ncbi:aristolochene synthase [Physcia stellaris]|nr:aristolochene synthase [Physcia stellaris]